MESWLPSEGPLLFAHRGSPREQPENSLEAFSAALATGADALEVDVHMTRDGHPVLSHDADGKRLAGISRAFRDCTLSEIKSWNLAAAEPARAPVRVPTFDEALAAFPHARFNVDVKQSRPDMLAELLSVIERRSAAPRVLLTSFSSATTRAIRRRGYHGATGLGRAEAVRAVFAPRAVLELARLQGARLQIPVRFGPLRLDRRELIAKMHALGIAVDYWVVNDPTEAERLLELGADGLVTDDPRALAELYARSPRTARWRERRKAQGAIHSPPASAVGG